MTSTSSPMRPPQESGPAWEIARLFPHQGQWSDTDYLSLNSNQLVELSDGYVEVLPMPKTSHQRIVCFLFQALLSFVSARHLGEVLFAPLRVRLREGKYREPDIVFMLREHADRIGEDYWDGPDLVIEVVSEDDPARDLVTKRREYAEARICEYWIVDPQHRQLTVLKLTSQGYVVHGEYGAGQAAASSLLDGFNVEVDAVLAAALGRD